MPKRTDRLLVAALVVLVAAIAATALRNRLASHGTSAPPPPATTEAATGPPAPVPARVRLVPSTTAFLPRCAAAALHLSVGPGAVVTLRYAATRPCHLPPLHLRVVLRATGGAVVYRGPALAYEQLSGNYARDGEEHAPLVGCTARVATAAVSGSGLSAAGAVRC